MTAIQWRPAPLTRNPAMVTLYEYETARRSEPVRRRSGAARRGCGPVGGERHVSIRIPALIALALAGCIGAPPERAPAPSPDTAAAGADAGAVFPDLVPIVPPRSDAGLPAAPPARRDAAGNVLSVARSGESSLGAASMPPAEASGARIVPQVDAEAATAAPIARRDEQAARREALADVTRKLEAFKDRAAEDLDTFSRLKLLRLETEALLLLLLTNETEREECRRILQILTQFPAASLEVAGLQFVLYQRLADYAKRDEMLEYLAREARARPLFRLEGVVFCEKAAGYGNVVPVARTTFRGGQRVAVYSGVRGAAARESPGGGREQHVQAYLSILDRDGKVIDKVEFTDKAGGVKRLAEQESPDGPSYLFGEYTLPPNLPPGPYRLKLSATDLVGRTESSAVASFDVSG